MFSHPSPPGSNAHGSNAHGSNVPSVLLDAQTWVFDLDNTLYSVAAEQSLHIDTRIRDYLVHALNVGLEDAHYIQKDYFQKYGTTLRGLMLNHDIDPHDYLDFVHDFDISTIPLAPGLNGALTRLHGRKVVFTNADLAHAQRILLRLGVSHHFTDVFDIFAADFIPKPAPETYERMLERLAINPRRAVMVEDIARNLKPASRLGMTTVWLKSGVACAIANAPPDGEHVDYIIDDLTAWLLTL